MFFKESTSHLRKDSSCLLLKYINRVLVLHLQLEQKNEIKNYTLVIQEHRYNLFYSNCKGLFSLMEAEPGMKPSMCLAQGISSTINCPTIYKHFPTD